MGCERRGAAADCHKGATSHLDAHRDMHRAVGRKAAADARLAAAAPPPQDLGKI